MHQPKIPFPSNDVPPSRFRRTPELKTAPEKSPWRHCEGSMPMCFEVRFRNGEIRYFPYSDLRGCRLLHQGHLVVDILGFNKSHVVIEGRHLGELAKSLGLGDIEWLEESSMTFHPPEEEPWIQSIEVEDLTGP